MALTGYVRQHHALWADGPLLAGVSAGSIVGSLLLGARGPGASSAQAGEANRRLPRLLACYALGLVALTAASLYAPLIAVAAPLAGLFLGPSLATLFNLASSASDGASGGASGGAPGKAAGGGTEAQGWLNSVMNGGAAGDAALAGAAAGQPVLALALAAALADAAAASSIRRH